MAEKKKYKSRFSGLQHDEATNAIVNKVLQTYLEGLINSKPNPNLLDNWYFLNPVNQRGVTTSTTQGYTIDRWFRTAYGTLSVTSNGVKLKGDNPDGPLYFRQFLENTLPTNTYTLSVLASDVVGTPTLYAYYTDASGNNVASTSVNISNGASFLTLTNRAISRVQITVPKGASVTLQAIKLELGKRTTLVHWEDDVNVVLNEIPDKAEQTRRCQRYYWQPGAVHGFGYAYSASTGYAVLIPPVVMRTTPTVVKDESSPALFNIRVNGNLYTDIAVTTSIYTAAYAPQIRVGLSISATGLLVNQDFVCNKASGVLAFSADL